MKIMLLKFAKSMRAKETTSQLVWDSYTRIYAAKTNKKRGYHKWGRLAETIDSPPMALIDNQLVYPPKWRVRCFWAFGMYLCLAKRIS